MKLGIIPKKVYWVQYVDRYDDWEKNFYFDSVQELKKGVAKLKAKSDGFYYLYETEVIEFDYKKKHYVFNLFDEDSAEKLNSNLVYDKNFDELLVKEKEKLEIERLEKEKREKEERKRKEKERRRKLYKELKKEFGEG